MVSGAIVGSKGGMDGDGERAPETVIDPESDLGRALAAGDDAPLVLASDRERCEGTREADPLWASADPERVRRALRESTGALAGVDVADLKRELREQRRQESFGRPA
jgi:hypothetical protein